MQENSKIKKLLKAYTKATNRKEQDVLGIYIREGLIARFAQSSIKDKFILKGSTVFQIFMGESHRPTKDIDFLGFGNNDEKYLSELFQEIIDIPLDDGLKFTGLQSSILGKQQKYQGARFIVIGELEGQPIKTQIDVAFGCAVYPKVLKNEFPTIIGRNSPIIRHYPKETVVAEKFCAIAEKGLINSRLKDYYDLVYLSRKMKFQGSELVKAVQSTFSRNEEKIPLLTPIGLTTQFVVFRKEREKIWKKFYQQGRIPGRVKLIDAINEIATFIMPVSKAARLNEPFKQDWQPRQGWEPSRINFKDFQQENTQSDQQHSKDLER